MYVYFFRHISEGRFKIGKANDVRKRFLELGGDKEYSKEESHYIRLNTPERALRIERVLHKLFESWNLPVSEYSRFEGDTEQFDLVCWPRVAKFVFDNSDLTDGAELLPLEKLTPLANQLSRSGVRRHDPVRLSDSKKTKLDAAIARAHSQFENAIRRIGTGVLVLNALHLRCCQILWDEDRKSRFIIIETRDKSDFETADEVIGEEWGGIGIRNACGRYGFSNIVGTIYGWKNRFIRVNLYDTEHAMFDPYREAIENAFKGLRLYGSCDEVVLMSPDFDL